MSHHQPIYGLADLFPARAAWRAAYSVARCGRWEVRHGEPHPHLQVAGTRYLLARMAGAAYGLVTLAELVVGLEPETRARALAFRALEMMGGFRRDLVIGRLTAATALPLCRAFALEARDQRKREPSPLPGDPPAAPAPPPPGPRCPHCRRPLPAYAVPCSYCDRLD